MKLLRARERIAVPWKNGGGLTHEVAIFPSGASWAGFEWRISIAAMIEDNVFSVFPDIDRTLAVLEGAVQLTIDGEKWPPQDPVSPPARFDGASMTEALILSAPVMDLNLMVRRGIWSGRIAPVEDISQGRSERLRLLVANAPIRLGLFDLDVFDVLRVEPGEVLPPIPAGARGWVVEIWPVGA